MVGSVNLLAASFLTNLSGSNTQATPDVSGISADLLVQIAQARSGAAIGAPAAGVNQQKVIAPWDDPGARTPASKLVSDALAGKKLFDASTKTFSTPGLTTDDRNLFALHAGVNSLSALVGRYNAAGVTTAEQARIEAAFKSGLKQLDEFLAKTKFSALSVTRGAHLTEAITKAAITSTVREYVTGVIVQGDSAAANAAFAGDIRFAIDGERITGGPGHVDIDLAGMGATPRSLDNVIAYMNAQLRAAGFTSQFSAAKQTAKAAGGADQYALKFKLEVGESISFSAPQTSPALYVLGADKRLVKIHDAASGTAPAPVPGPLSGANGQAFDKILAQAGAIGAVRATASGPDGSVYVVADVSGDLANAPIKGAQDVALFKYDSAGNVVFARTLGAADSAQGFALAVGADGRVAVGGALAGAFGDGVADDGQADAFVAVFDEDGVDQWSARVGSSGDDRINALAFGADGALYAAGQAGGALAGQAGGGDDDAFLVAYEADGATRATMQFAALGAQATRAIAVEDLGGGIQRVSLANVEAGKLVLRQVSDDGATLAAGAVRDLGALVNGDVVGLALDGGALYVAGNSAAGGIDAGLVARAHGGGMDGFVARLSSDLVAGADDRISYVGGAGDDLIAGIAVQGGQVWLGGDSRAGFGGQLALTERDGFVARLDGDGALAWTTRFMEPSQSFTAAGFAFDAVGASALDLLGLPSGPIGLVETDLLTSRTALSAGDYFSVSVNGRSAQKITIAADETISSLIAKVQKTILSAGAASANLASSATALRISATRGAKIQLIAGAAGRDALSGLGLAEGVIVEAPAASKAGAKVKAPPPGYGLGLASDLALDSKLAAKEANDQLSAALQTVQGAFRKLHAPASTAASGQVPAYMKAQLANYQAALARLTGQY